MARLSTGNTGRSSGFLMGRIFGFLIIFFAVFLMIRSAYSQNTDPEDTPLGNTIRGQTIAVKMCGRCHAVGVEGASPHFEAPPFRTLAKRWPILHLEEALAEGISVGHEEMPEIMLEPDDIDDLLAYIASINPKE